MMRPSSSISLKPRTKVLLTLRSLSSIQTDLSVSELPTPPAYIQQRIKYQSELAELRKGWAKQIQLKKDRDTAEAILQRQRIVLRQAIRLREDRAQALITAERVRLQRAIDLAKYQQHLANNLVISEKRQIVQQNRYSDMVQQLHDESHVWITKDNLEDRITPRLFRTMATTGLVTRSSNYWRYMSVPLTRERRMNLNEEKLVENSGKFYSTNDRYSPLTKLESAHRTSKMRLTELFLEPMISTGEERSQFEDILSRLGGLLERQHADDVVDLAQDERIPIYEDFDIYGKQLVRPRREITKAEWLIQQQRLERRRQEDQAYEESEDYEDDPDEEAEEIVRLPPKVVIPGGVKKIVKRVPRKR